MCMPRLCAHARRTLTDLSTACRCFRTAHLCVQVCREGQALQLGGSLQFAYFKMSALGRRGWAHACSAAVQAGPRGMRGVLCRAAVCACAAGRLPSCAPRSGHGQCEFACERRAKRCGLVVRGRAGRRVAHVHQREQLTVTEHRPHRAGAGAGHSVQQCERHLGCGCGVCWAGVRRCDIVVHRPDCALGLEKIRLKEGLAEPWLTWATPGWWDSAHVGWFKVQKVRQSAATCRNFTQERHPREM